MSNPAPLVGYIYELWIEMRLKLMRTFQVDEEAEKKLKRLGKQAVVKTNEGLSFDFNRKFINLLYSESQMPGDPFHNQWITHFHTDSHSNQIYVPSKFYMFINMREKVLRWEDCLEEHDEIPDCAVSIYGFHPSVKKNLVSVLQNISEWQKISDLYIEGLHCYHETEPILLDLHENTQSMTLMNCILPQNVL